MNESGLPTIPKDPLEAIKQLENNLSLPKSFYRKLLKDDDWSFIIRLHALVEAAVSTLIIEALGHPQLTKIIKRLGTQTKRAMMKELKLFDKNHQEFLRVLSEVRNDFVHDTSHVT